MTNTYKKTTQFLAVAALSGCILACSGGKKQQETTNDTAIDTEQISKMVEKEFKYPIPTSYEVTQLLQDADAAFVLDITNPVENVDKYETQRTKALNLGVYGADLSYASTYNKQEETMKFLEVSRSLINDLQISNVFTQDMANRIEANIDNKDSLIQIISKSFYRTYEQLNQNGQDKLALLVVAGSWIEGLYITTQLAISSNYDKRLMDIVGNQKTAAKKLAELCEKYKDDEDVNAVLPLIRFLNLTYDGVIEEAGITKGQLGDILDNVKSTRDEIIN